MDAEDRFGKYRHTLQDGLVGWLAGCVRWMCRGAKGDRAEKLELNEENRKGQVKCWSRTFFSSFAAPINHQAAGGMTRTNQPAVGHITFDLSEMPQGSTGKVKEERVV